MANSQQNPQWIESPLFTGTLMAATVLVSGAISHFSGDVTAMWLANGAVFAWLLPRNRHVWPIHLVAAALGNLLAGLVMQSPGALVLISVPANMLEIFVMLATTYSFYDPASGRFRISAPRFTLITLAVVGAICVACVPLLHWFYAAHLNLALPNWFMSDVLGMLLMALLFGFLRRKSFEEAFSRTKALGTWGCLLLVMAITWAVFSQSSYPLLFVVVSALVFVVFQRGVAVGVLALFLHAVMATSLTMHGAGPISLIHSAIPNADSIMLRVIYLQCYLLITLATVYPVGHTLYKQTRVEQLYQLVANNSRDVVSRTDMDGLRTFCSPSVEAVLGWTPAEVIGAKAESFMHPDERPRFQELLNQFREGLPSAVFPYRARTKAGGYLHLEAHMRMLREPVSGQPYEIVSTARDISERIAADQKLKAAYLGMERLASLDGLTGLANRRVFDETMEREWRRAMRERTPLALLLMDVDLFKDYNDALGHPAGDACLRRIAHCLAEIVQRPGDLVARYGGEEFVALLPITDEAGALHIAHRILDAVRAEGIPHPASHISACLTLSVGLAATIPMPASDPDMLIAAADAALYTAKRKGRSRIEAAVMPRREPVVMRLPVA
jgi:diguanylate cyclase (GGDEF)-like protein/PAS domain S-box-containing protein